MTEKHIYNFSGRGPANPSYVKLWLDHFHNGMFAMVRPASWRLYCRLLASADFQTYQCEISHSRLATDCGMTRQTVPELIRDLEFHNLITFKNKITRAGKQPNKYFIEVPEICQTDAVFSGQVIADREVDITVTSTRAIPSHVRLSRELFDSGFFSSLGRKHTIWKLYCSLLYRADFETGYCFPALDTLASDSMMAVQTVVNAIKFLVNCKLITIEKYKTATGKVANGYYVWPLSATGYIADSKKPTSKTLKSRHPELQKADIRDAKKPTSLYVGKIETNINNHINTTTPKQVDRFEKNKIEDLLKHFYAINPKRMSLKPDTGMKWLADCISKYGYDLVKYVLTGEVNKELYAQSRLENCMESLAWCKEVRTAGVNRRADQVEPQQYQTEPEQSIADQIVAKRKLITDYRAKLRQGGPMDRIYQSNVNRLERELAELLG